MDNDLSLSQSLGGLRIANPDENVLSSPTSEHAPEPHSMSSHSSHSTVTGRTRDGILPALSHENSGQNDGGLGFNPDAYNVRDTHLSPTSSGDSYSSAQDGLSQRRSYNRLSQQSSPTSNNPSMQSHMIGQPTSAQPSNDMYMQQNVSNSSQGSYRYREDMAASSDGSMGGVRRTGSRKGMPPGVAGREPSRTYRQPANGANNPIPPRRNSQRSRAPTGGSQASGYESAGPYVPGSAMPKSAEEWRERGAAVTTRQEVDASGQTQLRTVKKGVKDFNFGRTLGEGSYSTVLAATDRQNLKEYAIKVLDKRHIIKEKKVKYVNIERDTLNRLTEHPGIVRLYYTFQDDRSLYFVLDLASGGELLGVLKKMGSFDVECTKFYGAQILDSVAYMHTRGVIHRDLKPENVLLDRDMHVKITDFGTAKILPDPRANGDTAGRSNDDPSSDRAVSFVGTAEYVSPELLRDKNACKASDLWAFGCIIYQLLAGRPPFKAGNEYLTFQKILALDYSFPAGFPHLAQDLVERLLVLDPAKRIPVDQIMNHRFFEGVQWGKGLWRERAPRLKAYVAPPGDPIRLNGSNQRQASSAAAAAMASLPSSNASQQQQQRTPSGRNPSGGRAPSGSQQQPAPATRPQLRGVTDLPPPSQLDIDWSPVLTQNNERILKLGNLIVHSGPQGSSPTSKTGDPGTPSEKPKFSRFFTATTVKKRERLVLITSSARLIIAPAGGNEKKAKMDVNFLAKGTTWKSFVDAKGLTAWSMDTKDKSLVFEDPRATTADPNGSKYSTQEWIDSVAQARELALAVSSSAYSDNSLMTSANMGVGSAVSSPTDASGGAGGDGAPYPGEGQKHNLRSTMRKGAEEGDPNVGGGPFKGRKRFSRRHSKNGLAAVF